MIRVSGQQGPDACTVADLKADMDNYLGNLKETKVKSLEELVDWNATHAREALTEGTVFFKAMIRDMLI